MYPPKNNNKKHKTTTRTHTKNNTHTQNNKNNPPTTTKKRRPFSLETNHLQFICGPKADYMTHMKHRAAGSWGHTPSSSCSAASPSPSGRRCFSPLAGRKDKGSDFCVSSLNVFIQVLYTPSFFSSSLNMFLFKFYIHSRKVHCILGNKQYQ